MNLLRSQEELSSSSPSPVCKHLRDSAQLPLFTVTHGVDITLISHHHQVITPTYYLHHSLFHTDQHWLHLHLAPLHQPYRPRTVPECSPEPDLPCLCEGC